MNIEEQNIENYYIKNLQDSIKIIKILDIYKVAYQSIKQDNNKKFILYLAGPVKFIFYKNKNILHIKSKRNKVDIYYKNITSNNIIIYTVSGETYYFGENYILMKKGN